MAGDHAEHRSEHGRQRVSAANTGNASYDADGNLTNDGRWSYTWDAENRLISMVANTGVGPQQKLIFAYDWQGRRVQKTVSHSSSGAWVLDSDTRFAYEAWNLVAELSASGSPTILTPLRFYTWGTDLSGTLQGAGGVGGLLFLTDEITINNQPSSHFVAYDGSGNVAGLVNAADGTISAQYEYGPFGELLRVSGSMGTSNPFLFSTRLSGRESGLYWYGFRYYKPMTGCWLSRDPLGDKSFLNVSHVAGDPQTIVDLGGIDNNPPYGFVVNNALAYYDKFGLDSVSIMVTTQIRPPDPNPGIKTSQIVTIDEYGEITSTYSYTGTTDCGPIGNIQGHATFSESVSGTHPIFAVDMAATAYPIAFLIIGGVLGGGIGYLVQNPVGGGAQTGATIGRLVGISYDFKTTVDLCARSGSLSGEHHSYPSYTVQVLGSHVYDFQQRSYSGWLGIDEISVPGIEFNF